MRTISSGARCELASVADHANGCVREAGNLARPLIEQRARRHEDERSEARLRHAMATRVLPAPVEDGGELTSKRKRYAELRIPYYVVWDPECLLDKKVHLHVFELRGELYVPRNEANFPALGLRLIPWEGVYEGFPGKWIRWATPDRTLIPTGAEATVQEREGADAEIARANQRADAEAARAARLEAEMAERIRVLEAKLASER